MSQIARWCGDVPGFTGMLQVVHVTFSIRTCVRIHRATYVRRVQSFVCTGDACVAHVSGSHVLLCRAAHVPVVGAKLVFAQDVIALHAILIGRFRIPSYGRRMRCPKTYPELSRSSKPRTHLCHLSQPVRGVVRDRGGRRQASPLPQGCGSGQPDCLRREIGVGRRMRRPYRRGHMPPSTKISARDRGGRRMRRPYRAVALTPRRKRVVRRGCRGSPSSAPGVSSSAMKTSSRMGVG